MRWLLLLLLVGCMEPSKDDPIAPLPEYRSWYEAVEGCSGVYGRFGELRFYVVEELGNLAGQTFGKDIFLVRRFATSRFAVSHEMLHTLIGDGSHRSPIWDTCHLRQW